MRFCASGADGGVVGSCTIFSIGHRATDPATWSVKKSKLVFKTGFSGWADGMLIPHLLQSRGRWWQCQISIHLL